MDEKKVSMIVLVFIFMVAIPSTIFLFSDSMSSGDVVIGGLPRQQTNYGDDPAPYSYEKRGVEVPIYNDQGVAVRYERRGATETARHLDRPSYEGTYSAMKSGCPPGCVNVMPSEAMDFKEKGYTIIKHALDPDKWACKCVQQSSI